MMPEPPEEGEDLPSDHPSTLWHMHHVHTQTTIIKYLFRRNDAQTHFHTNAVWPGVTELTNPISTDEWKNTVALTSL